MNKQETILLVAAILLCSESLPIVLSQTPSKFVFAPAIEWQKDYGHSGPYDDTNIESASNLIQTSDGRFVYWTDETIQKLILIAARNG